MLHLIVASAVANSVVEPDDTPAPEEAAGERHALNLCAPAIPLMHVFVLSHEYRPGGATD